jgi:RHS repeat-associated protein
MAMAYDGTGRRISKTRWVKARGDEGWSRRHVTHYTGIGTEVRENFAGHAKETKVVVNMPQGLGRYGIEDADHVAENGSAQTFEWFLKNHLGSTMLVYGSGGGTSGGLQAAYDYRSFGEQVTLTSPSTGKVTENFTGKERDDETQLDYFGARYLDPMLGVWISVDPMRQHFSPYTYGSNNPIISIDPDGNEDIYYLLGGNKNAQGQALVSLNQYKQATSESAQAFRDKGYTVKYVNMTKASFNRAVKDPEAKKLYITGHINKANGKLMSQGEGEKWLGAKDIQKNKNIDLNVSGCRSQGLIEKQWGNNFNSATGLNPDPVLSTNALEDINRAASVDALIIPQKNISQTEKKNE